MVSIRPLEVEIRDSCFCHWPVSPAALRPSLPDWLTVDTVDGEAWITINGHTIRRIESFGIDIARPTQGLTVRTCVRGPNDQRGVYYFAYYVDDRRTAQTTSRVLRLPARHGTVTTADGGSDRRRHQTLTVNGQQLLDLTYTVSGATSTGAPPDSLAHFLIERDRYFTTGAFGIPLVGSVGHDPYQFSPVAATVTNRLSERLSLPSTSGEPLVQYTPAAKLSLAPPSPVTRR